MNCPQCESGFLALAHDADHDSHQWPPGEEDQCPCQPDIICLSCNADVINQRGFLLIPRAANNALPVRQSSMVH